MQRKTVSIDSKTKLSPEDAFGRVIRERRLALGLTQADLEGEGEDGLERSYISRLEAGRYQVCLRGILHLAHVLQMTAAELMNDVETKLKGAEGEEKVEAPGKPRNPKRQ